MSKIRVAPNSFREIVKNIPWSNAPIKSLRENNCASKIKHQYLRCANFSTLGNPMFPEKAQPDIPTAKLAGDDNSFLGKHGGKVGLAAFGVAVGLFYTYYKSSQLKTEVEDALTKEATIEPYEMLELRFCNKMPLEVYGKIVDTCLEKFPHGELSYADFITTVSECLLQHSQSSLRSGHILDRLVASHHLSIGGDSNLLPLSYLLVALNLTLNASGVDRSDSLFVLAQKSNKLISSSNTLTNAVIEPDIPGTVSELRTDGIHYHIFVEIDILFILSIYYSFQIFFVDREAECSLESALVILSHLCSTWQVIFSNSVLNVVEHNNILSRPLYP